MGYEPISSVGPYVIKKELGRGTFGVVYCAVDPANSETVAIKVGSDTIHRNSVSILERETAILREFKKLGLDRNIVRYRGEQVVTAPGAARTRVLVMEYANQGDLFTKITSSKRLPEDQAKSLFRELLIGIEKLHNHGYIHGDIKPENILLHRLNDGNIIPVLGDLGMCTKFASVSSWEEPDLGLKCGGNEMEDMEFEVIMTPPSGTPNYASPEALKREKIPAYQLPKSEVWSLGILLQAMVTGEFAYCGHDRFGVLANILNGKYRKPHADCSREVVDLISRMLQFDPDNRPSVADVLKHPWLCEPMFAPAQPQATEYTPLNPNGVSQKDVAVHVADFKSGQLFSKFTTVLRQISLKT